MASEKDRLSELADNFLCYEILSKLPLQDAIRFSILSRKWRSLRQILHFSREFFFCISGPVICSDTTTEREFTDIIDNILKHHSAPLKSFKFDLLAIFSSKSSTEKIEEWIERIRIKGVKEIDIKNGFIPTTLFACQTLTTLKLSYFSFPKIPESFLGFSCLVSCSLNLIVADTEINAIENFIALCPQLQNFGLSECYGINNLKICAQHLKYLQLRYSSFKTLIVDCPPWMKLEEIDCQFGALVRNSSELSSFKVSSPTSLRDVNLSAFCLLERLLAAKTIRKISIGKCKLPCAFRFLNMLGNFPNLEKLTINECMVRNRNMVTVKEMGAASDINYPNLKEVFVDFLYTMTGNEVAMLNFLVANASSLKIMTINLSRCSMEVKNQVLDLKNAFTETEIRILDKKRVRAGQVPLKFALELDDYL